MRQNDKGNQKGRGETPEPASSEIKDEGSWFTKTLSKIGSWVGMHYPLAVWPNVSNVKSRDKTKAFFVNPSPDQVIKMNIQNFLGKKHNRTDKPYQFDGILSLVEESPSVSVRTVDEIVAGIGRELRKEAKGHQSNRHDRHHKQR